MPFLVASQATEAPKKKSENEVSSLAGSGCHGSQNDTLQPVRLDAGWNHYL